MVVWEPILPTDWWPPNGRTLNRISDERAQQFWDPDHVVANALNQIVKQKPPQPAPSCCFDKGFYWDDAILYSSGGHWQDHPASLFWNGPIVHAVPALEKSLNESLPATP